MIINKYIMPMSLSALICSCRQVKKLSVTLAFGSGPSLMVFFGFPLSNYRDLHNIRLLTIAYI